MGGQICKRMGDNEWGLLSWDGPHQCPQFISKQLQTFTGSVQLTNIINKVKPFNIYSYVQDPISAQHTSAEVTLHTIQPGQVQIHC